MVNILEEVYLIKLMKGEKMMIEKLKLKIESEISKNEIIIENYNSQKEKMLNIGTYVEAFSENIGYNKVLKFINELK